MKTRSRGQDRAAASLSRPMSSLALSPHTALRLVLRLTCHTGLSLLFEVGVRPPHDGMRRMGRPNLSGALAADERQDQRPLRAHPTRRPREDIFLPKQNALISLIAVSPAFSVAASGNRRKRGAVLAPPELAAINPHPVQNDSQTPGDRDDRSTHPASLGHSHAPCLQ